MLFRSISQAGFRSNVHKVRAIQRPKPDEPPPGVKSDFQAIVAWDRNARLEHFFEVFFMCRIFQAALPRADQLHTWAASLESTDEAPQGHGTAVYLGRIGLGDHHGPQRR